MMEAAGPSEPVLGVGSLRDGVPSLIIGISQHVQGTILAMLGISPALGIQFSLLIAHC